MKGMDFIHEAQDYSRVIDDLKNILQGNVEENHATIYSHSNQIRTT